MTWTTRNGTARIPLIALLSAALAALFAVGCQESIPVEPSTDGELEAATQSDVNGPAHRGGAVKNFVAPLSGDQEVPSVETKATGVAKFKLNKAGDELNYKLNAANIENVLMAHIHLGPAGENGGVVVWLYPEGGPPPQLIAGRFNGTLAEGTITADDLVGSLEGGNLQDLIDAMEDEQTYVNVHTDQNRGGEIRGQIDRGNGVAR